MSEVLLPDIWSICICGIAAFLGTGLQRLAGQGFGMVTAPIVALVAPAFLPATLLMLGLVIGLSSSAMDVRAVNRKELPAGFAGRTLGAVIAAWIATLVLDTGIFAIIVATLVYLGIALSLVGVTVPIRRASLFIAGAVAGIMGTLTAVGAPPMALLYQHEEQKRSAVMQNTFFFFGMIVSMLSLAAVGLVQLRHFTFALTLLPVVIVALVLSQPLAKRVAKARVRPWALALSGLSATILLAGQFV